MRMSVGPVLQSRRRQGPGSKTGSAFLGVDETESKRTKILNPSALQVQQAKNFEQQSPEEKRRRVFLGLDGKPRAVNKSLAHTLDPDVLAQYKSQHDDDDEAVRAARRAYLEKRRQEEARLAVKLLTEERTPSNDEKQSRRAAPRKFTTDHMGKELKVKAPALDRMPSGVQPNPGVIRARVSKRIANVEKPAKTLDPSSKSLAEPRGRAAQKTASMSFERSSKKDGGWMDQELHIRLYEEAQRRSLSSMFAATAASAGGLPLFAESIGGGGSQPGGWNQEIKSKLLNDGSQTELTEVQKAIARKMLAKMTGAVAQGRDDAKHQKSHFYQPLRVHLTAGQDLFCHPIRQGVTYTNAAGLVLEGTAT